MNTPRYTPDSRTANLGSCPDFEDLSRFVDLELEQQRAAEVGSHVTECARCSRLVAMVGTWFDTVSAPADTGIGDTACASMESLVGYLTNGLGDGERHNVDAHVRACDECMRTLTLLHSRLGYAADIDAPVPAAVLARVAEGLRTSNAAMGYADWSAVGGWVTDALKLPVLIPAAVAAGALLVVAEQQMWVNPSPLKEMSRAVPMQQTLRVTAAEAMVRIEPSSRADVVTTIERGATVTVGAQERDWYRVSLADGKEGWIDRRAFD